MLSVGASRPTLLLPPLFTCTHDALQRCSGLFPDERTERMLQVKAFTAGMHERLVQYQLQHTLHVYLPGQPRCHPCRVGPTLQRKAAATKPAMGCNTQSHANRAHTWLRAQVPDQDLETRMSQQKRRCKLQPITKLCNKKKFFTKNCPGGNTTWPCSSYSPPP